jgi:hypothetical protein
VGLLIIPPVWSGGQSFWLQIQRFRVRFPALPDFLSSLVRTTEKLLEGKVVAPVYKPEFNDRGNPSRWPRGLYPQKLALTSPTSSGRSVGIVRSRTKATEFSLVGLLIEYCMRHFLGEYQRKKTPGRPRRQQERTSYPADELIINSPRKTA